MIYWLIFIGLAIWYNWYKIEKRGIKPTYLNSNWARGIFGLICLVLTYKDFDPLVNGLDYLPFIIFQLTSFWLLFDPILNITRGKPLGYRGKSSGWMDSLHPVLFWVLKVCALVGAIFVVTNYSIPLK